MESSRPSGAATGPRGPLRTSDFVNVPPRGAPLVVLMIALVLVTGSAVGFQVVGGTWPSWLVLLPFAVLIASPAWMRMLAERSWPSSPVPHPWFEQFVRLTATGLTAAVVIASIVSALVLAWGIFALQCVFTAITAPIALRRYPGFLPRAQKEHDPLPPFR